MKWQYESSLRPILRLSPFQFQSTAIRKVEVNQEELEVNGRHHLLVYPNGLHFMGENILTVKKRAQAVLLACKCRFITYCFPICFLNTRASQFTKI